ncbi:hypothetical protein [Algoriphagus sp.]|uniref:hypothetical protein n=1 Tax=Algoriphagus sp. TaxID=1872435 RepID=UPI00391C1260
MKLNSTLILLLSIFLAVSSCKEIETPNNDPVNNDPVPVNVPTAEISIEIPEGTTLNLNGMKVVANTFSFPVGDSGKSKIAFQPGQPQMAFLMDAQDRVIFSGFISDANKKLSVASTAEVLIYFRSGAFILPFGFREKYIAEISTVKEFDALIGKLEALFKQNPINFSSGIYLPLLDEFLAKLIPKNDPLDIKARQINFDPNGVRSGIQVMDNNFQSVILRNSYRRRAHAFVYKSSFKDKDGNETILKSSFEGSDPADGQQAVNSPTALDGFLGTLAVGLAGQGARFIYEDSPPINIPLAANESEAKYKVRVIGASPGVSWLGREHTDAEKAKWEDLMIETLFMDMVIPLMSEAFAAAGDMATEENAKTIAAAVKKVVDFTPFIKELSETKDLTKFVSDVLDYFISDKVSGDFQEVLADLLAQNAMKKSSWDVDLNKEYRAEMKKARFLKLLQYIDLAIKGADFVKMIGEISLSSPLEIFEVIAKDHDIVLSPMEASVTNFAAEELTVQTKTELGDGQAFLYKWSTSGKYGHLRDNLGNKGTEIESGQKTISYKAETSSANLPDNAVETVTVIAYVKQGVNLTKIGEAKATIAVKPARLEIKPKNVTLSGKDKQKVKLYVEWANGDEFYKANDPTFDYKFEWSTGAKYGNFVGGVSSAITHVPSITYQALDEEVKNAVENIKLKAYIKSKDSEVWIRYDDIEGTVLIDNDELKKVIYVTLTPRPWGPTESGVYTNCGASTLFLIPPQENAVSYTATIISFSPRLNPHPEGTTRTWLENPDLLKDGFYEFAERSAGAASTPTWLFNSSSCAPWIANANSRKGIAKVVITLKK